MTGLSKLIKLSTSCALLGCLSAAPRMAFAQIKIEDPDNIHRAYKANKIAAIDKWNNREVSVYGIVDDIEMGFIQVDSTALMGGAVFCYYTDSISDISRFTPGQRVIATGRLQLRDRRFMGLKAEIMGCSISPR